MTPKITSRQVVWVDVQFETYGPESVAYLREFTQWSLDNNVFPVAKGMSGPLGCSGGYEKKDAAKVLAKLRSIRDRLDEDARILRVPTKSFRVRPLPLPELVKRKDELRKLTLQDDPGSDMNLFLNKLDESKYVSAQVVEVRGRLLGWSLCETYKNHTLFNVYVDEAHRSKGIGRALLIALARAVKGVEKPPVSLVNRFNQSVLAGLV